MSKESVAGTIAKPWYTDYWPWLLIAAPAVSVVGGMVVFFVAIASNDGLVADDYYKQGLAINRTLSREHAAAAAGMSAHLLFAPQFDRFRLTLTGGLNASPELVLRLVHPTRAGLDQNVGLKRIGSNVYEGAVSGLVSGHWRVHLEDSGGTWRLSGEWAMPSPTVVLQAR